MFLLSLVMTTFARLFHCCVTILYTTSCLNEDVTEDPMQKLLLCRKPPLLNLNVFSNSWCILGRCFPS